MTKVSISFAMGGRTVTVEREAGPDEEVKTAVQSILSAVEEIALPGKASSGQLRALWGKAMGNRGWDKEKVKGFLKERLGTSSRQEIVGVVDKTEISLLIDEIGGGDTVESNGDPGKASAAQIRALWGKALGQGWERERVKRFLEEKLNTSREDEIVGKADKELVSGLIEEIAAA